MTVGVAFKEYTASSLLYAVFLMLKNALWLAVLGGVSRQYVCVSGITNLASLEKLRQMVEESKLMIEIDSCWEMEDALKVIFEVT